MPDCDASMKIKQDLIRIGEVLTHNGWKLATAESCTGGLLAHWITSCAGCSAWYCGGAVVYADTTKMAFLDVSPSTIERYGAVSRPVASAMAKGACEHIPEADIAVSITGIAGPTGGRPGKPVGLVYIAVATVEGMLQTHHMQFQGSRHDIQIAAGHAAVEMVYTVLRDMCEWKKLR